MLDAIFYLIDNIVQGVTSIFSVLKHSAIFFSEIQHVIPSFLVPFLIMGTSLLVIKVVLDLI